MIANKKLSVTIIVLFLISAGIIFLLFVNGCFSSFKLSQSEALLSLPYLTWVPAGKDIRKVGVTKYDPEIAYKGINIYNSSNLSVAYLMDMRGNVMHTWTSKKLPSQEKWYAIQICDNGDLLVIVKHALLARLD